jgi:hypothetical protein
MGGKIFDPEESLGVQVKISTDPISQAFRTTGPELPVFVLNDKDHNGS